MVNFIDPGEKTTKKKWIALACLAIGVFMSTLDTSIVNISLPALVKDLNTDFATVQWVVISYVLVIASLILTAGRLGDMHDKRKIYLCGLVIFTIGSFLCGFAPGIYWLIGFRAFQGIGAMMMQAVGNAMVTEIFPQQERGRALGILGTVVSLGIAIGPPLGGIMIGVAGWRSVFLVNIPIGIVGLILVTKFLPHSWPTQRNQKFDYFGAVLLFFILASYALGMTLGQNAGFFTFSIQALLASSLIGIFIFIKLERRIGHAMLDISIFKNLLFSLSLLLAFLVFNVMASTFILPFFLELVKGFPAEFVGVLLMANPVMMGIVAPLAGSLSDRFGSRGISLIGLIIFVMGSLSMSTINESTTALGFIIRMIPFGVGLGLFQSPNNSAIMGSVSRERLGIASGLCSLSRVLGNASGLPLMGAIFYRQIQAITHLPGGLDISTAPAYAITNGVQRTYQIAACIVMTAICLAVIAFIIESRSNRIKSLKKEIRNNSTDLS